MMRWSLISSAGLLLAVSLASSGCSKKAKTGGGTTQESSESAPPATAENIPGYKVEDLEQGSGETAAPGKLVSVHYTGWLGNGAKFDSSKDRQPLEFELGKKQVLKGWDIGIPGMKVGGKRKLTLPPELGYGDKGSLGGAIPPKSTLIFEVELVAVK